jgi:hypothetical protein
LNDHKDSLVEHTREAATIGARRDAIKLRIVDSGTAIDDFAHELLGAYPNAMVLRDADIYKGPFPSYALAIADQGESFDIRLVDFDPRNSLASIEKAVLEAAGSASPGDLASVAELPGRAGRRL